jgi:hypothetical protein
MAQTRIDGKFGILYKWDAAATPSPAYVVVGCATTNGFNSSATVNEQDVNKCDPETINKNYGGVNQSLDFEGHIVTDADKQSYFDLLADQEAQTKVVFKYDFDAETPDTYVRYFTGIISDISSTQEVNQDSTWSMTLDVDGKSTTTDPMV